MKDQEILEKKLEEIKILCTEHFLVPFEGTGAVDKQGNFLAYLCPAGVPTIAWGLTFDDKGVPVKLGDVWGKDKAIMVKSKVLSDFLNKLIKASPNLVSEPPARVSAVLSWVYNLGIGNYLKSTFKKRIDRKDWDAAGIECRKWNKAGGKVLKGLTRRREAESKVIVSGSITSNA